MAYLKSYNRDKRVQSLSRGVCGGGVKGGYEVGAPESPLSMGPEYPCYATVWGTRRATFQSHLITGQKSYRIFSLTVSYVAYHIHTDHGALLVSIRTVKNMETQLEQF